MPKGELTVERRTILLNRLARIDRILYPADQTRVPRGARRERARGLYFRGLDEYLDRLPRVLMSVCPFTGQPLLRAFDPWGLDGPWWHKTPLSKIKEPPAPDAFKVLLGALNLGVRRPTEAGTEVTPGPEVPFVVPHLLGLPGMVAVVSQLRLKTGDIAYPIAYFSKEDIAPPELHQPWLRQDLWFKTPTGEASWLIANDLWDFDLKPWVERNKLRWVAEVDGKSVVLSSESGKSCPYLDLPGERLPQTVGSGDRDFLDLPNGEIVDPFEE